MIKESEKYKAEDDAIKQKIDAKNALENYAFSVRNSLKDEKLKDKFTPEERSRLEELVDQTFKWIESNQNEEPEMYKNKQSKLEEAFNPIMTKIYQQTGGATPTNGFSENNQSHTSNVDEVD